MTILPDTDNPSGNQTDTFITRDVEVPHSCRPNERYTRHKSRQVSEVFPVFPVLLDLGEAMVVSGADVHTVEVQLQRLGIAYGACEMDVLVITTSVIVTATLPNGIEITQTRRISDPADNDFDKLERYSKLCATCIENPIDPVDLRRMLTDIKERSTPRVKLYVGGMLSCAAFAIFFGGSWADALVSAIFAILICALMVYLRPITPNTAVFDFLASLISGIGICITVNLIDGLSLGMVMVGDIMILIPGVAMTSAFRDMISGDTVSGTMRLIESFLWTSALALGFMAAMLLLGLKGQDINSNAIPIMQFVVSVFCCIGFAMFFNVRGGLIWICTLGGVLTEGVYLLAMGLDLSFSGSEFMTAAIAAIFAAIYSEAFSRKLKVPITVFFIISVIPLVPGRGLYFTMQCAVQQNWTGCFDFALSTFQIALGIAVGIVVVWAFVQAIRSIEAARKA